LIAFELQRAWELTGATLSIVHPIVQFEVLIKRNTTLCNRSVRFIKGLIYVWVFGNNLRAQTPLNNHWLGRI